jgi:uncharacterized protein YraI
VKRLGKLLARVQIAAAVFVILALTSGCSLLFGAREAAPTAAPDEPRQSVPTFTPTPLVPPTSTAAPTNTVAPTPVVLELVPTAPPVAELIPTATPVVTTSTPANIEATLTIGAAAANLRQGPGTEFALAGAASAGQSFSVVAKSPAGDWWQICCINGSSAWVFGDLVTVQNAERVAVTTDIPTPPPTPQAVAVAPTQEVPTAEASLPEATAPPQVEAPPVEAPAPAPDPSASSAGYFDPNAAYQIVHFKLLGLDENNGGIRDSRAQHLIFLTVLDQNGNGVDGAVVKNLVGEQGEFITGSKGPGKAEITMYYEPFKLQVAADPSGAVTSQISNQMGLAFPHLPDLVGKMGDENYEYGVCPTLEIKCQWPIQLVHFSYEITFQKVK